MKHFIKTIITKLGDILGLSIHIQIKRDRKSDFVLVDKFVFSPFLNNEMESQLYKEAMHKSDATWSDNFYKQCRYYSLSQLAEVAAKRFPDADIAECGVWKGHSAWMIAKIFSQNNFKGHFHIFDSFEGGLSDKVAKDKNLVRDMTDGEVKNEKEIFSSRENQVAKVLSDFSFVKLYSGWIPVRFPEISDKEFSFVHIDVDLYEPTLSSLAFFWPRLANGGFIVVDDYGSSQFPGATTATDEFLAKNKASFFYKVPMGACFIVKP
ncbi:MAG: class I SAM-dependent methyltransferase [Methylotenera sp.]|nr:class I SAM-dependent methyltransferase [Methylotenera sp.]